MEGKRTLAILLGILLLIGAVRFVWKSSVDYPPMGYVTGTIRLDGKPLSGVMVAFYPEKGRPSTAVAEVDGSYELRYTRNVTGAKVGPGMLHLSWETGKSGPAIPERYGPNKSELTVIVDPGDNVFDFELHSDQEHQ